MKLFYILGLLCVGTVNADPNKKNYETRYVGEVFYNPRQYSLTILQKNFDHRATLVIGQAQYSNSSLHMPNLTRFAFMVNRKEHELRQGPDRSYKQLAFELRCATNDFFLGLAEEKFDEVAAKKLFCLLKVVCYFRGLYDAKHNYSDASFEILSDPADFMKNITEELGMDIKYPESEDGQFPIAALCFLMSKDDTIFDILSRLARKEVACAACKEKEFKATWIPKIQSRDSSDLSTMTPSSPTLSITRGDSVHSFHSVSSSVD